MIRRPQFRILTTTDCRRILAHSRFGRLAYVNGNTIEIEPIGYVLQGDWLYARSAYGAKVESLHRRPYAAFEVDVVDGPFDWRSVVVRGTVYELPEDGSPIERKQRQRAMRAMRLAMPIAFTNKDPAPERQILYGLHIDSMTGRMAQFSRRGAIPRAGRAQVRVRPAPASRSRREEY